MTTPTPGSDEAVALGCTCPRMDNARGRGSGYTGENGEPLFYITEGCQVHAPQMSDAETKRFVEKMTASGW